MQLVELGNWNGFVLHVDPSWEDVYLDATEMAQANGKLWANYWQNSDTQDFVNALSDNIGIPILNENGKALVYLGRGRGSHTFVHPDIGIHFAQWLSAGFAVWVAQRIRELLRTGSVSLDRNDPGAALLAEMQKCTSEIRETNRLHVDSNKATQHAMWLVHETLKQLQRAPVNRLEAEVERQLQIAEGGTRQYEISFFRIDLLTDEHCIEIKHWEKWREAVKQVVVYSRYVEQEKRIHLFARPFDKPVPRRQLTKIERVCWEQSIELTWHKWDDPDLNSDQGLLPLKWK